MKRILYLPAFLLARLMPLFGKLRQAWAFTCLQAQVGTRVPTSVVALGAPEIHGTARIEFGESLYLYRDLHLETQGPGTIHIGDRVVISRGVHLVSFADIRIGAGSMIGEYASIRDANHHYGGQQDLRHSGHSAKPITIGRNVWIGRGVMVLPGITIGDNAVIGANAVVTHDVPAAAIVAGVPAKPIPSRRAA